MYVHIYMYGSPYDRVVYLEKSELTILLCVRRVASQLTLGGTKVYRNACRYTYMHESMFALHMNISKYTFEVKHYHLTLRPPSGLAAYPRRSEGVYTRVNL